MFSGDDVVAFRSLLLGVDASMIIAPSIFPVPYQTAVRHVPSGNLEQALEIFSDQVPPLIHLFGLRDEIPNTKALFKEIGIFRSDELRLPCSPERRREVMLAYQVCTKRGTAGAVIETVSR